MAGAAVGKLEPFCADNEAISVYLERVELYFNANSVQQDKRVPVFLTMIGAENYAVLRNLLAPRKPSEQSLDVLMETMKRHFEPKKVVMA